jgi:hypothetical protein
LRELLVRTMTVREMVIRVPSGDQARSVTKRDR